MDVTGEKGLRVGQGEGEGVRKGWGGMKGWEEWGI